MNTDKALQSCDIAQVVYRSYQHGVLTRSGSHVVNPLVLLWSTQDAPESCLACGLVHTHTTSPGTDKPRLGLQSPYTGMGSSPPPRAWGVHPHVNICSTFQGRSCATAYTALPCQGVKHRVSPGPWSPLFLLFIPNHREIAPCPGLSLS